MMKTVFCLSISLVFAFLVNAAFAQNCVPPANVAGTLDTCFGTGGKVTTDFSAGPDGARSVAIQPDGKIVAAGNAGYSQASDFAVARYNPDGSLDTSFSGDGKLTTDFEGLRDAGMTVFVQSDGKILLGGTSNGKFALARYNPDGSLDVSFDGDGLVLTDVGSPIPDIFSSMVLQPDGKIVMAGSGNYGGFPSFFPRVVRYNFDGSLDNSFGIGGKVVIESIVSAKGLAIQTDGKLVVTGFYDDKMKVARLNPDGSMDDSFGTAGVASFGQENRWASGFEVVVENNGKILVGGESKPAQYRLGCTLFVRFSVSGTPESDFMDCGSGFNNLLLQPDGKILMASFGFSNDRDTFEVKRYHTTGASDLSFNGTGRLRLSFSNELSSCYSVAMQKDNRIVAVGSADSAGTTYGFAVARIMSGLAPRRAVSDFDGDGKTDIGIFRPVDGSWWYSRSTDGVVPVYTFGTGTDVLVPGDYTGDGKTDIAVFRPSNGNWFVQRSEDNSFFSFPFGTNGDIPAPADYDGDGKADAAVFRPSTGTWFVPRSSDGGTSIVGFGTDGDKPVAADYDGDGESDIAIFRPSDGSWWYVKSSTGLFSVYRFGVSTDKPVQGDWTGDGKADIAVFRPSTGNWFVQRSEDNSFFSFPFGTAGDIAAPGDYDGDGRLDPAVFRPTGATWFINRTTAGILISGFGAPTDRPIPNVFVP